MDNPEEIVDEDEEQADDENEGKIVVSNAKKLETRVEIVNKIAEMTQKTVNEDPSRTTLFRTSTGSIRPPLLLMLGTSVSRTCSVFDNASKISS